MKNNIKNIVLISMVFMFTIMEFLHKNNTYTCNSINEAFNQFIFTEFIFMRDILIIILLYQFLLYFDGIKGIKKRLILAIKWNGYWLIKLYVTFIVMFFASSFVTIYIQDYYKVMLLNILIALFLGIWMLYQTIKPKGPKKKWKLKKFLEDLTLQHLLERLAPIGERL